MDKRQGYGLSGVVGLGARSVEWFPKSVSLELRQLEVSSEECFVRYEVKQRPQKRFIKNR